MAAIIGKIKEKFVKQETGKSLVADTDIAKLQAQGLYRDISALTGNTYKSLLPALIASASYNDYANVQLLSYNDEQNLKHLYMRKGTASEYGWIAIKSWMEITPLSGQASDGGVCALTNPFEEGTYTAAEMESQFGLTQEKFADMAKGKYSALVCILSDVVSVVYRFSVFRYGTYLHITLYPVGSQELISSNNLQIVSEDDGQNYEIKAIFDGIVHLTDSPPVGTSVTAEQLAQIGLTPKIWAAISDVGCKGVSIRYNDEHKTTQMISQGSVTKDNFPLSFLCFWFFTSGGSDGALMECTIQQNDRAGTSFTVIRSW